MPTAAGASDRESAFSEKTSPIFVMVRGGHAYATRSQREVQGEYKERWRRRDIY